jgi:phage repressor protein C with HTH and peptisase S24 domain
MLTHADIWRGIDRMARSYGLTPSGLARRAGLDPTTFNKSKRTTRDGKQRWPSTESIAKVLAATGADLAEFVSHAGVGAPSAGSRTVPFLSLSQASEEAHFSDSGRPRGEAWDAIAFPGLGDGGAFALEIGSDYLAPVYRDGDVIVISPDAGARRGDRVVLRRRDGDMNIGTLRRQSAQSVELAGIVSADGDRTVAVADIAWLARIVWSSQ